MGFRQRFQEMQRLRAQASTPLTDSHNSASDLSARDGLMSCYSSVDIGVSPARPPSIDDGEISFNTLCNDPAYRLVVPVTVTGKNSSTHANSVDFPSNCAPTHYHKAVYQNANLMTGCNKEYRTGDGLCCLQGMLKDS